MRTSIIVAALLHQALSFLAPPVRVVPSLRVKSATRATPDDDATATAAEDAVAVVEDDATPKRRPLRGLWRRLRSRKAEEVAEPEPEQPRLKVGESVVVEATGRSGKVSLVAANGWCQVTYDDEECEGQTETLQCPDLVREEAALAETIDAEVSDFDEVLIKWWFKEDPRIPEECGSASQCVRSRRWRVFGHDSFLYAQVPRRPDDPHQRLGTSRCDRLRDHGSWVLGQ